MFMVYGMIILWMYDLLGYPEDMIPSVYGMYVHGIWEIHGMSWKIWKMHNLTILTPFHADTAPGAHHEQFGRR